MYGFQTSCAGEYGAPECCVPQHTRLPGSVPCKTGRVEPLFLPGVGVTLALNRGAGGLSGAQRTEMGSNYALMRV